MVHVSSLLEWLNWVSEPNETRMEISVNQKISPLSDNLFREKAIWGTGRYGQKDNFNHQVSINEQHEILHFDF